MIERLNQEYEKMQLIQQYIELHKENNQNKSYLDSMYDEKNDIDNRINELRSEINRINDSKSKINFIKNNHLNKKIHEIEKSIEDLKNSKESILNKIKQIEEKIKSYEESGVIQYLQEYGVDLIDLKKVPNDGIIKKVDGIICVTDIQALTPKKREIILGDKDNIDDLVMVHSTSFFPSNNTILSNYKGHKTHDEVIVLNGGKAGFNSTIHVEHHRRTTHVCINHTVGDTGDGNKWENMPYIIIEPLKHHINEIHGTINDSWIMDQINLSSEAIIVIEKRVYEKMPDKSILNGLNFILYEGEWRKSIDNVLALLNIPLPQDVNVNDHVHSVSLEMAIEKYLTHRDIVIKSQGIECTNDNCFLTEKQLLDMLYIFIREEVDIKKFGKYLNLCGLMRTKEGYIFAKDEEIYKNVKKFSSGQSYSPYDNIIQSAEINEVISESLVKELYEKYIVYKKEEDQKYNAPIQDIEQYAELTVDELKKPDNKYLLYQLYNRTKIPYLLINGNIGKFFIRPEIEKNYYLFKKNIDLITQIIETFCDLNNIEYQMDTNTDLRQIEVYFDTKQKLSNIVNYYNKIKQELDMIIDQEVKVQEDEVIINKMP